MTRVPFLLTICLVCMVFVLRAQDYSNRGLMEIKDKSEALRMAWIKAFDEAVQRNNFAALQPIRQENESFLDKHMSVIRRLYAEGDGRALLSAVNNYMRIERQFVSDVMVPAEAFTANSREGIDRTYQKIDDFGQKEKVFLIDINNAVRSERMDEGGEGSAAQLQMQQQEEDAFDEPKGSVLEGRPSRKKGKLPHQQMGEDDKPRKANKKSRRQASGSEDEE